MFRLLLTAREDICVGSNSWVTVPLGFELSLPSGYVSIISPFNDESQMLSKNYKGEQVLIIHNSHINDLNIKQGAWIGTLEVKKIGEEF